jgi:hypothetical protein
MFVTESGYISTIKANKRFKNPDDPLIEDKSVSSDCSLKYKMSNAIV